MVPYSGHRLREVQRKAYVALAGRTNAVELIVRDPADLQQRLKWHGPFSENILREGKVLYAKPHGQEWLSFATRDLEAARVLSHLPGQASTACFHSQKAVEKALKSLYAASGQTPPKTHDLDVLRDRIFGGNDLSSSAEACAVLSMYAVDSRYPGVHIQDDEVLPAIHRLRRKHHLQGNDHRAATGRIARNIKRVPSS
ncbi:MAG: hypothetical protein C7B44_08830 [Sulfobacillus thermosulfidooxidans]|nr:MAG: hypothetical protein C7B44_08830 [Sulfobacillus thermosulfidooxidans]